MSKTKLKNAINEGILILTTKSSDEYRNYITEIRHEYDEADADFILLNVNELAGDRLCVGSIDKDNKIKTIPQSDLHADEMQEAAIPKAKQRKENHYAMQQEKQTA